MRRPFYFPAIRSSVFPASAVRGVFSSSLTVFFLTRGGSSKDAFAENTADGPVRRSLEEILQAAACSRSSYLSSHPHSLFTSRQLSGDCSPWSLSSTHPALLLKNSGHPSFLPRRSLRVSSRGIMTAGGGDADPEKNPREGANALLIKTAKDFFIPRLEFNRHKGQNGRVCVIGGSLEFTGAPYFSAISALRMGMDLAYIITTSDAAVPIKSYSPELIVYPLLPGGDQKVGIEESLHHLKDKSRVILKKSDVIVMGPGLGAPKPYVANAGAAAEENACPIQKAALLLLDLAMEEKKFVIIDADMIRVLCQPHNEPSLHRLKHYRRCLLTPNKREFDLIHGAFQSLPEGRRHPSPGDMAYLTELARALRLEQSKDGSDGCKDHPSPGSESGKGEGTGEEGGGQEEGKSAPPSPSSSSSLPRCCSLYCDSNNKLNPLLQSLYPSSLKPFFPSLTGMTQHLYGPSLFLKGTADIVVVPGCVRTRQQTSDGKAADDDGEGGSCPAAVLAACGLSLSSRGSPKRSGGQGDVLGGVLATFIAWWHVYSRHRAEKLAGPDQKRGGKGGEVVAGHGDSTHHLHTDKDKDKKEKVRSGHSSEPEKRSSSSGEKQENSHTTGEGNESQRGDRDGEGEIGRALGMEDEDSAGLLCAAFNASLVVRRAAAKAFELKGRSMLAGDVIELLGETFREMYDEK